MKIPKRLQPLIEDGLVDEVICQLMSGKEAMIYMVRCGSEIRCAKVYKEATKRSFKKAVQYREGRKGVELRRILVQKTRIIVSNLHPPTINYSLQ